MFDNEDFNPIGSAIEEIKTGLNEAMNLISQALNNNQSSPELADLSSSSNEIQNNCDKLVDNIKQEATEQSSIEMAESADYKFSNKKKSGLERKLDNIAHSFQDLCKNFESAIEKRFGSSQKQSNEATDQKKADNSTIKQIKHAEQKLDNVSKQIRKLTTNIKHKFDSAISADTRQSISDHLNKAKEGLKSAANTLAQAYNAMPNSRPDDFDLNF